MKIFGEFAEFFKIAQILGDFCEFFVKIHGICLNFRCEFVNFLKNCKKIHAFLKL